MARRDTRELILQTSLELFNALGEPHVTTNAIADELDISPGNLYYHFRSKDDIVIELFKRFATLYQPLLDIEDGTVLAPEDLWLQLHLGFELKGAYRFLYRNLADLTARIADLDRAMRALLQRERRAVAAQLNSMERAGALQLRSEEKQQLADSILLSSTYWLPFAELADRGQRPGGEEQVRAIARVLLLVAPWLRDPARQQFRQLALDYLTHAR